MRKQRHTAMKDLHCIFGLTRWQTAIPENQDALDKRLENTPDCRLRNVTMYVSEAMLMQWSMISYYSTGLPS